MLGLDDGLIFDGRYVVDLYISDLRFGYSNVINFDKSFFADTAGTDK